MLKRKLLVSVVFAGLLLSSLAACSQSWGPESTEPKESSSEVKPSESETSSSIEEHVHSYDVDHIAWNWANDHSSATATFTCLGCEEGTEGHSVTVDATVTQTRVDPTCVLAGSINYKATATFQNVEYTDLQKEDIQALGHDYDLTNIVWEVTTDLTADEINAYRTENTQVLPEISAKVSCTRCDHEEALPATVTQKEYVAPGHTTDGAVTFLATVNFEGTNYTHDYEVKLDELGAFYDHYLQRRPTAADNGSREFWVSQEDNSVLLEAPTSYGQIIEKGQPDLDTINAWAADDVRFLAAYNAPFSYLGDNALAYGKDGKVYLTCVGMDQFGLTAEQVNGFIAAGIVQVSVKWEVITQDDDDTDEIVFYDGGFKEFYFKDTGKSGWAVLNLAADTAISVWAQREHGGTAEHIVVLSTYTTDVYFQAQSEAVLVNYEQVSDTVVTMQVNHYYYSWTHVALLQGKAKFAAGYTKVRIEVTGSNHQMFVYLNSKAELTNYDHPIACGGGTTILDLDGSNDYIGFMTSHVDPNGAQDEDGTYGKFENISITFTFFTPRTPQTVEDYFYTDTCWTSTGAVNYDFDNEKVSVADTWSMWFSQTYAQNLLDAGYKTIGFTVTIPNPELYITVVEQSIATSYKTTNGILQAKFAISSLASSTLTIRANTVDMTGGDHNQNCTGTPMVIDNAYFSTEDDPVIIKANARARLAQIFTAEATNWKYFRHNGWGDNHWGPTNDKAIYGTATDGQSSFFATNDFLQDMKQAGYTKFSLDISAQSVEEGNPVKNIVYVVDGGAHPWNTIYQEIDTEDGNVSFTIDVTPLLSDLNAADIILFNMREAQPTVGNVKSIITVTNLQFYEA